MKLQTDEVSPIVPDDPNADQFGNRVDATTETEPVTVTHDITEFIDDEPSRPKREHRRQSRFHDYVTNREQRIE